MKDKQLYYNTGFRDISTQKVKVFLVENKHRTKRKCFFLHVQATFWR
jgi:hypothetical protein